MPSPNLPAPVPLPGATYRFVVQSAEEAVRIIHEKLGADARVISVKQIGNRGFASLLRAPQLEVIAEVAPKLPPALAEPAAPPLVSQEDESAWLPDLRASPECLPAALEPLDRLLSRAGIGEQTLARWRSSPRWETLRTRPLGEALKEVVEMLRAQWQDVPARPLGSRVAFFGPPGSGATTALCKALTIDVFFQQQAAVAMKLDGDQPNPIEGLAMFCEALGVPLLRATDDLEQIPKDHRVYVDAMGAPLNDGAAWRDLGRLFGEFYIETRVLVLNAAYEIDLLKRAYTLGREAGATHVVFTHLDEVHRWGKLWELLLGGGLHPMFFSCGQNVSGDVREDTFELMIQHMFGGLKL